MAKLPVRDKLHHDLEYPLVEEQPRDYLGMSNIGATCDRSLQYYFRFASPIKLERRIRRLFDFGHLCEEQIISELVRIGCIIVDREKEYIGFAGHWKGHIDGTVYNVPGKHESDTWLLEMKTHAKKFFTKLKKEKVKKGFPRHYDQCQRYMADEPNVQGCMYIGYNKDDSDFYIEFIERDEARMKELKRKEQHIVLEDKLFPRIGTGQITWFECQMCDFKRVCFEKTPIDKNCRTCKHVECIDDGKWSCANPYFSYQNDLKQLPVEKQRLGCDQWELDEHFFS